MDQLINEGNKRNADEDDEHPVNTFDDSHHKTLIHLMSWNLIESNRRGSNLIPT